jgi:hypothetical protein
VILVSLDIDGTVEGGDPPGPVPFEFARRLVALGVLVGSSSDRTVADQRKFWQAGQVGVAFVVLKHDLPRLAARYPARRYLHVGDSMMDEHYAGLGGFTFWNARTLARHVAAEHLAPAAVTKYLLRKLAEFAGEDPDGGLVGGPLLGSGAPTLGSAGADIERSQTPLDATATEGESFDSK